MVGDPVHHKQAVDLQSRINDLIGIQALPAIWSGQQPYDIAGILLEAVVRILDLDFAYAHVRDSLFDSGIELMRLPQCRVPPISAEQFRRDLRDCLGGDLPTMPVSIPNPLGRLFIALCLLAICEYISWNHQSRPYLIPRRSRFANDLLE